MTGNKRKNEITPFQLGPELFTGIFWRIRERPEDPETVQVEKVLECLSRLRSDSPTREKMQVLARLYKLTSHYVWGRRVMPQGQVFGVAHTVANSVGGERLSEDKTWELQSVGFLLDIVPYLGEQPRIRRCAECKAWFYAAKRADQEYCSGTCRQHHYDTDPARKKAKAADMRQRRRDAKGHAQNPKSGVGLAPRRTKWTRKKDA